PDPQFRRVVLRHRKAQQGINRFSGERSEPKPIGQLTDGREIGTQADWASMSSANDHAFELMKNLISKEVFLRSQRKA
ncbi:hypothetical protein, partial [Limnobacter sp.]|uniref:hypothetical protein n=1 Tax=Limnobacter sp. TaxID=2003368 RepID=UPI00311FE6D3